MFSDKITKITPIIAHQLSNERLFYAKFAKSGLVLLYFDYICKIVLVTSSNMKKRSDTFQIAADIQWEYAGDGIVRQIMGYDEHLMMVKVKFDQGAIGKLHQHPHTQSTYVASGSFEVTIGEEKKILKAGDGYYVAPNLPHGCVCLEAGVLIDTFTPMREDFLK